jgi:hypothetical protein
VAPLAIVVILCRAASDELHAIGDDIASGVFDWEMDVIARYDLDMKFRTVACRLLPISVGA